MSCTSCLHSLLLNRGSNEDLGRWAWMRFKGTEEFNVVVFQTQGDEIIFMVDANADYDDEGFSMFVQDCHMVDLHEDLYTTAPPATYTRGQRKIDYILGAEKISAAVIKDGMLSFDDGLKFSDHRALCIDLYESALFHVKSKDATARKNCGLSSKNKEQVKAYLEIVHAQFLAHNIYARCLKLTEMGLSQGVHALQKGADHLDHQVTIIVLQAERKTTRKKIGYGWSPK